VDVNPLSGNTSGKALRGIRDIARENGAGAIVITPMRQGFSRRSPHFFDLAGTASMGYAADAALAVFEESGKMCATVVKRLYEPVSPPG
jgi:hypothetical protein